MFQIIKPQITERPCRSHTTAACGPVHEPETPERWNQGVRWKIVFPGEFWTAVHKWERMKRQVQRECLRTRLWTRRETSRSTFHLEKLLVPQLIKIFGKFYKSRSFSTALTKAVTWIQFTLLRPIRLRSIFVSSSLVLLCLPSVIFPPVFPTKPCTNFSCPPHVPHVPPTISPLT
jgi:hypothetical protein